MYLLLKFLFFYNSLSFSAESIFSQKVDIFAESTFSCSCSLALSFAFWRLSRSSNRALLMRLSSARFPPFMACLCCPCGLVICVLRGFLCVFGVLYPCRPVSCLYGLILAPFAFGLVVLINKTKRAGAGAGVSLSHSLALCLLLWVLLFGYIMPFCLNSLTSP